jgi:hypothetical protein
MLGADTFNPYRVCMSALHLTCVSDSLILLPFCQSVIEILCYYLLILLPPYPVHIKA